MQFRLRLVIPLRLTHGFAKQGVSRARTIRSRRRICDGCGDCGRNMRDSVHGGGISLAWCMGADRVPFALKKDEERLRLMMLPRFLRRG